MPLENSPHRVAAVTGATGSIGKAISLLLAENDFKVILLSRDKDKCKTAVNEIQTISGNTKVSYKLVELSSKKSIQTLANNWDGPLHVLVNNAAISPISRSETPEGIELQFATNVLGYFWMTIYFKDILSSSAPSRIVNVASYWAGNLDLGDLEFNHRPYHNHDSYRQSKQANRMLTPVFAQMFKNDGINVNACHPGDVNSALSNSLGFGGSQSPSEGAKTPVWLASSSDVENITGKYFEDCQETPCRFGADMDAAHQLYEICLTY